MSRRTARQFAWAIWLLSLVLTGAFVVLVVLSKGSPGPLEFDTTPVLTGLYCVLFLVFSSIGSLVVARHPHNPIGWLFCFTGLGVALSFCAQLYADYTLVHHPGAAPGGEFAAWISHWLGSVALFVTPLFLLFLFPTGTLTSRRWRPVIAMMIVIIVLGLAAQMFQPGLIEPFETIENPLGVPASWQETVSFIETVFTTSAIPASLLGIAALVGRMRRSTGEERQQLKWFAYTASLMGVGFAGTFVASILTLDILADFFFLLAVVALVGIPFACGIAILKYRLYDIDVIINRTLVYGALTALLVLVYAAGVVGLGAALREPTGQQSNSLAVAASTLAVAALFRPARARIQAFIDRRFYRAKYDAAQTLDTFSARLRDEVDIDDLSAHLLGAIRDTMQPAHASLWLRGEVER